jgi:hypothetical protein
LRFVHTFLFKCPDCRLPVAAVRIVEDQSLKGDNELIEIDCGYCDTLSEVYPRSAIKHYVEDWPS